MPQPNFEYKKALALGDEAFQSLITTKIVELVPDAKVTWTNYTLFLNTNDSDMQRVTNYLASTYGMDNIDINLVGDEYAIDFM
jgi:hypothetical protein